MSDNSDGKEKQMEEPWILAEQEAQRADRQRKRRPVCADCGRWIAEGWAFELDKGEFLCEKCARLRVVEI